MIQERLQQLGERIDGLSLRERALLFGAVLVVIFTLWDRLLMAPVGQDQAGATKDLEAATAHLARLNGQIQALAAGAQTDPDLRLRQRLEQLEAEHRRLDERLESATLELIDPREMARALEKLLERQGGLRLVRLENLGAEPLLAQGSERVPDAPAPAEQDGVPRIYRHGLRVELAGSYQATLDYLRAVEALPHNFFWDSLDLAVEQYPTARVRITVHTLSLREGWIGV